MQAEEKERLEAKTLPLRNYLMCHVMPTVTQGLIEVCKTKPEDPVDYLVGITFCSYGINEHFHHHILCFLVAG